MSENNKFPLFKSKKNKRYDKEPSEWQKGWADLAEEYTVRGVVVGAAIALSFAGCLSGFMIQSFLVAIKAIDSVALTQLFRYGILTIPGAVLTAIFTAGMVRFVFWIRRRYKKEYHTDRDRNYHVFDIHSYGDADWQDINEIKRCFYRDEDPGNITHNLDILGRGIEDHMIYSLRDDLKSMNGHMAIIGMSGSGKSAAYVTNKIYQCLKRGVSMVVTDSKGDLYANTAKLAHDMGYKVKMLNLKSDQLVNSDGCDFFKFLGGDDTKAQTLAETIIKNTEGDAALDYFAKNELNLLKALILYVSTVDGYNGRRNLAEIYNMVSTSSLEEMHQKFGQLNAESAARQSFNVFAACEPKVQGQILNGMAIRLQILSNKWARHIVSSDDIDLIAPMKEKCIYYVVISDTETAYKFIATLFFADLFIELCGYYDRVSQYCRSKNIDNPCIPVEFILDEYANTGAIPDFDVKVTTVRSRQIGITIIIQDIGQLKDMYGDNLAFTILNNMPLKMLLKTTDINTAKYFSDLMGIQTVRVENRRYSRSATDIVQTHDELMISEGAGKRCLMNPDEIINSLDNNHLILLVSGFHPIKLQKFMFFEHPMTKLCKSVDPSSHTPKWRKKIDKERAAKGLPPIWQPTLDISLPGMEASAEKPKKQPEKPRKKVQKKPQAAGEHGAQDSPETKKKPVPKKRTQNSDPKPDIKKDAMVNTSQAETAPKEETEPKKDAPDVKGNDEGIGTDDLMYLFTD